MAETALLWVRGDPGKLPLRWRSPADAPIDISLFVITATLRWNVNDPHEAELTVVIVDDADGEFQVEWTGDDVAALPAAGAELVVRIDDLATAPVYYVFPIIGRAV